jgi:membrane protein implicated in regulation of membrane protease activity
MLIVALVMAVIGLAALVTAVVTSNEIIAWVCIGASVIGVVLLIVDALRERSRRDTTPAAAEDTESDADYPDEAAGDEAAGEEDAPPADETKSETSQ